MFVIFTLVGLLKISAFMDLINEVLKDLTCTLVYNEKLDDHQCNISSINVNSNKIEYIYFFLYITSNKGTLKYTFV